MGHLLTAKYYRGFDMVKIDFMDDGSAEYVTAGEISDEELNAIIAAEGGHVDGWKSEISL